MKVSWLLHPLRKDGGLPGYAYWSFRNQCWGEAVWSILHGKAIRSFSIPEGPRRVLNLWGPNGHFRPSRLNAFKVEGWERLVPEGRRHWQLWSSRLLSRARSRR